MHVHMCYYFSVSNQKQPKACCPKKAVKKRYEIQGGDREMSLFFLFFTNVGSGIEIFIMFNLYMHIFLMLMYVDTLYQAATNPTELSSQVTPS